MANVDERPYGIGRRYSIGENYLFWRQPSGSMKNEARLRTDLSRCNNVDRFERPISHSECDSCCDVGDGRNRPRLRSITTDEHGSHQMEWSSLGCTGGGDDPDPASTQTALFDHLVKPVLWDALGFGLVNVGRAGLKGHQVEEGFLAHRPLLDLF